MDGLKDRQQDRLLARITEIVNMLIVSGDIKNPRLSPFASAGGGVLSKDKAYCTLYVNCLDEKSLRKSVEALNSAAPFIQSRLAANLKTRNTPKLTFKANEEFIEAQRINDLLETLKKDV